MIVVDIGNSGLRGAKVTQNKTDAKAAGRERPGGCSTSLSSVRLDAVTKLSWSAIGEKIFKEQPEQSITDGERWIPRRDRTGNEREAIDWDGIEWLVRQLRPDERETWKIASVNQSVFEVLIGFLRDRLPKNTIHVVRNHDVGIPICVEHPERVGIDRLLAARAAWVLHCEMSDQCGPLIVVQAGTALTVDWVDDAGKFCGGAILPGVGLSLQYLAAGTDQLPWLPSHSIVDSPTLPGKNTEQAIAAGVHAAVVGGAKFLIDRYRTGRPIPVVVSGGDGRLLRAAIGAPVHYIGNLVLLGLSLCQTTDREAT